MSEGVVSWNGYVLMVSAILHHRGIRTLRNYLRAGGFMAATVAAGHNSSRSNGIQDHSYGNAG